MKICKYPGCDKKPRKRDHCSFHHWEMYGRYCDYCNQPYNDKDDRFSTCYQCKKMANKISTASFDMFHAMNSLAIQKQTHKNKHFHEQTQREIRQFAESIPIRLFPMLEDEVLELAIEYCDNPHKDRLKHILMLRKMNVSTNDIEVDIYTGDFNES